MFLDIETGDLELHDLVQLIKLSHTVLVYMSEGYFESQYCVLELAVAVASHANLVFVRDYQLSSPPDMSVHSKFHQVVQVVCDTHATHVGAFEEVYGQIKSIVSEAWEACVVYHPELFEPYIQAVQQKLRVSDRALQAMYQGGGLQILDSQAKEMDCKQLGAGLLQVWRMLEELGIKC